MQAIQAGDAAAVEVVLAGDVDVDVNESTPTRYDTLDECRRIWATGHNAAAAQTRCRSQYPKKRWIYGVSARSILWSRDVVRELLASGADVKATNISGTSPEMWAMARGFRDLADLLKRAGERGANVSPRMTLVSEPIPYLEVIQPRVVARDDQDPGETTVVRPQASAISSNSEYLQSPVIDEQNQIRRMELNETAAEIKAARAVDDVVCPIFPFRGLTGSIEYQLAAYGRRARTRHDTFGVGNLRSAQVCPAYAAGKSIKRDRCGRLISETH